MKIFSDRNFYNLPTNENFCTPRKFHKNRKKVKISEIIYGMSSYRDEFWCLQMGSLSVVDGFETNSWPHTHSGCDFKKWWIFMNFRNFHLWVKLLKLWNRPISAGKSWFDIRNKFFDVRTPLYPIIRHWGGHLAYLRHISSKTSIFR